MAACCCRSGDAMSAAGRTPRHGLCPSSTGSLCPTRPSALFLPPARRVGDVGHAHGNKANSGDVLLSFTTGPDRVLPSAWRVAAVTDARFHSNPPWQPLEVNLTNASLTSSGEGWRVTELQFFSGSACGGELLKGAPIGSGDVAYSHPHSICAGAGVTHPHPLLAKTWLFNHSVPCKYRSSNFENGADFLRHTPTARSLEPMSCRCFHRNQGVRRCKRYARRRQSRDRGPLPPLRKNVALKTHSAS